MIRRTYLDHKAIFIYDGPKLGLAIVIYSIQQSGLEKKINKNLLQIFGEEIY